MDGLLGVMTALVMTAAPGDSWEGRTYVGVALPLAPGGFALESEQERDDGFSVTLGLGALYRPPLPGFSPWTVTVAPRAQLSLGWSL